MDKPVYILSTRPLDASLINEARAHQIWVDELALIETTPVRSHAVAQSIAAVSAESAIVIFTSMNAVEAVADYLTTKPNWQVYCIGETTKALVANHIGAQHIAGTANSAAALANLMAQQLPSQAVHFFCGDQRREELPNILLQHGFEVQETVVYRTVETPQTLQRTYDGILFFSPSAVRSFFKSNQLTGTTTLFAIGETTAHEISQYSHHHIVTSTVPGKENLFNLMLEHYTKS